MIEGEEACQEVLVCQVGRPVVGGEDGAVEGPVGVGEPLGTSGVGLVAQV